LKTITLITNSDILDLKETIKLSKKLSRIGLDRIQIREKNISDERLKDKAFGILFQRKYREQLQNTLEEIRSEAFVDIKISS